MFAIIGVIVMIKIMLDMTDFEEGIMLYLSRIFVIPLGAIFGAIGGIILDSFVCLVIILVKWAIT